VLLDEVDARSRLGRQGLVEGDIIVGVNRVRVRNLADFKQEIEKIRGPILLQIQRRGRSYVVRVD